MYCTNILILLDKICIYDAFNYVYTFYLIGNTATADDNRVDSITQQWIIWSACKLYLYKAQLLARYEKTHPNKVISLIPLRQPNFQKYRNNTLHGTFLVSIYSDIVALAWTKIVKIPCQKKKCSIQELDFVSSVCMGVI